ncbi:MAG: stage III sporulation protein AB, partial [Clostridia bacterium]|nr:stage III sporulation protein AB [Clostridia bacterium]
LWKTARLSWRTQWLDEAVRLTRRASEQIRFSAAPTQVWLRSLVQSGEFRRLTFLAAAATCAPSDFHAVWRRETAHLPAGLSARDAELIRGFGERLGASDVAGQLAICEEYGKRLEEQREEARAGQREKSRLYSTLGLMGGLGAALLVL